jgi:5-methylcytosine-specific restriction endonuclease McrA
MFSDENAPLALLIEVTPKLAKKRFRDDIYRSWDYKCGYCDDVATSLDHIVPRFKSGSSNRNNLIPACRRCNSNKGSTEVETWYRQQDFFTQAKMERISSWMSQEFIDIFSFQPETLKVAV